jgi:hypothetical protein
VNIQIGDTIEMKKPHPCGERKWLVLRIGADFRLRCLGCGREMMITRIKAEKSLKKLWPGKNPEA